MPLFSDISSNRLYPSPPLRNFNSEEAIKSVSAYTPSEVVWTISLLFTPVLLRGIPGCLWAIQYLNYLQLPSVSVSLSPAPWFPKQWLIDTPTRGLDLGMFSAKNVGNKNRYPSYLDIRLWSKPQLSIDFKFNVSSISRLNSGRPHKVRGLEQRRDPNGEVLWGTRAGSTQAHLLC